MDDEIADHLPSISLQKKLSFVVYKLLQSTYALRSQQQLIREIAVNDQNNQQNNGSSDSAASWQMKGEPVAEVVFVEDQAADNADDPENGGDHAPPGHDDATDLQLKAEQELF